MSRQTVSIGRFDFEWNKENKEYECRGETCYNDEHDEMPEPGLWKAAHELARRLNEQNQGKWYPSHSEKGWVEIQKQD